MIMSSKAVLENVRRYRAIASLYRQTAAFRPPQRFSLLEQAKEWEARVGGTRILLFDASRVKIPLRAIGGDACGGSATRHTVGEVFDCPQEYIGLPPSPI